GLHPLALPLLIGAWFVYAGVMSLVGLWFSIVCKTTLRATVLSLVSVTGLSVGHWLLWMCCVPCLFSGHASGGEVLEGMIKFEAAGPPPVALGFAFSFSSAEAGPSSADWVGEAIGYSLAGLLLWFLLGAGLAITCAERFRVMSLRVPTQQRQGPAVRTKAS